MASVTERNGKFLVRVTRKGYPQINRTFAAKRDALAFARCAEGDMDRGTYKANAGERVTFRSLLERYRESITPTKRGYVEEGQRIAAMLKPESAAAPLLGKLAAQIKATDVAAWRDRRCGEVAPATVVREWQVLAHVVTVARREWGYEGLESPFSNVRKPEVRNSRERRVSPEELEAICAASGSAELATLIRLAVETGARRGELLGLAWKDIDLCKRVATLRQTKNGEVRQIPLSPTAVTLLQEIPVRHIRQVFSLRPDSVTQAFRRSAERARKSYESRCRTEGVKPDPLFLVGLRPHDARHEACSRLAERGFSTMELAAVSGHKTLQLLNRYTHLRAEDLAIKLAVTASGGHAK